jgi:hypothetical protein
MNVEKMKSEFMDKYGEEKVTFIYNKEIFEAHVSTPQGYERWQYGVDGWKWKWRASQSQKKTKNKKVV